MNAVTGSETADIRLQIIHQNRIIGITDQAKAYS